MARGQDTGNHPNRQVSLESFLGVGDGVLPSSRPVTPPLGANVLDDVMDAVREDTGRAGRRGNRIGGRKKPLQSYRYINRSGQ